MPTISLLHASALRLHAAQDGILFLSSVHSITLLLTCTIVVCVMTSKTLSSECSVGVNGNEARGLYYSKR
jgi:hypothetical protein